MGNSQVESLNGVFWAGTALFFGLSLLCRRLKWIRHVLLVIPVGMIALLAILGDWQGVRDYLNWLSAPQRLLFLAAFGLMLAMLYYREWTGPGFAGLLLAALAAAYIASAFDPNFFLIVSRPDNIAITLLIFAVVFFVWLAFRQMSLNDRRIAQGQQLREAGAEDQVFVWPDLAYVELIAAILCTAVLIIWTIAVRAPLEQPANPQVAPNPAKAPWYFLGLQELLVYFDAWIAGVLLPGLIVFGLCALPYLDRNPRGNGYYTLRERPLAVTIYLVGFLLLWVVPIVLGTFLRGPNWNFFGPYEYWDPNRPTRMTSVNLSEVFWVNWLGRALPTQEASDGRYYYLLRELPGLVLLAAYFLLVPWILKLTVFRKLYAQIGRARYAIMMVLLTCMALVPIKMLLRWLFDLKYIVALTEWSLNI